MPDPDLIKGILNFGSFGLITWLFVHTYTRLIPSLQDRLDKIAERFETSLEKQHADCNEMLERQREAFARSLADEQSAHERAFSSVADSIRHLKDRA